MNCNDINVLINDYLDGNLTDLKLIQFENHLESCDKCKLEFEEIKFIHEIMADSELSSLPENFEEELKVKLENINLKEKEEFSKKDRKNEIFKFKNFKESKTSIFISSHKKVITSIAALFMIGIFTLSSMDKTNIYEMASDDSRIINNVSSENMESFSKESSPEAMVTVTMNENLTSNDGNASASGAGFTEESNQSYGDLESTESPKEESALSKNISNEVLSDVANEEPVNYNEDRLIIKNGYIEIDVLDFEKTLLDIKTFVTNNGGYISDLSSSEYGEFNESKDRNFKSGYINVRIPKTIFDKMFSEIGLYGNVKNTSISTNDITDQYRSISDELLNLEVREKKLREIMAKAVDIKDVIEVERELSRVRGEINRLSGNLQNWESLVELSSVNIQITEVKTLNKYVRPVDASLLEQAKYAFIKNLNNLMMFLERFIIAFVGNIPTFIIIGFLALVARIIYKRRS